jgi:hypothetical protein
MHSANKENQNEHQVAKNYLSVQMLKPGHISMEKSNFKN